MHCGALAEVRSCHGSKQPTVVPTGRAREHRPTGALGLAYTVVFWATGGESASLPTCGRLLSPKHHIKPGVSAAGKNNQLKIGTKEEPCLPASTMQ